MNDESPEDRTDAAGSGGGGAGGEGGDGHGGGGGDWDEVELDEVFVLSAERHEPSGRARMLSARWKRNPPEQEPWRTDQPPAGWIWSRGRKRRRR